MGDFSKENREWQSYNQTQRKGRRTQIRVRRSFLLKRETMAIPEKHGREEQMFSWRSTNMRFAVFFTANLILL